MDVEYDEQSSSFPSILIILDQKQDEELGVDFISLPEPNRVAGLWNLLPGAHFVYIKNIETEEGRIGEFIYVKSGEIKVLKRTDNESGHLFELIEEYYTENYKESLIIERYRNKLATIPNDLASLWQNITNYINSELIRKLRPIGKRIKSKGYTCTDDIEETNDTRSDLELRKAVLRIDLEDGDNEDDHDKVLETYNEVVNSIKSVKSIDQKVDVKELKQKYFYDLNNTAKGNDMESPNDQNCSKYADEGEDEATESSCYIYYSDVPMYDKRVNKMDMTPESLTNMHIDTSRILDLIMDDYKSVKYGYKCVEYKDNYYLYVLGELQYSFILFLLCYNIDSFQQYRKLLRVFCNAEHLIVNNDQLSCELFKTLKYHIETWDDDYDIFKEDNFFNIYLNDLREIVVDNESQLSHSLPLFNNLEDSFKLKFGISLFELSTINIIT